MRSTVSILSAVNTVSLVNTVNAVKKTSAADGSRQSLDHRLLGNWGLAQARREVTEQATGDRAGQMAVP